MTCFGQGAKASLSTGGLVTPQATFQALKYARSAMHGYDQEFMRSYLPEIIQEMATGKSGGGRGGAGTSLAAFKRMFVDSTLSASKYGQALLRDGLIDPNLVQYGSSGKIKTILPGGFFGSEIAGKNPFQFMDKFLVPALKRAGVDLEDHNAIVRKVSEWGGTDIGKQISQILVIQRKLMAERVGQTNQADGVDDAFDKLMKTYNQQVVALEKQSTNLMNSIITPWLPMTTGIIGGITDSFKSIAKFLDQNKTFTKVLTGGLGIGAMALLPKLLKAGMGRGFLGAGLGLMAGGPLGGLLGGMLGMGGRVAGGAAAGAALGGFDKLGAAMRALAIGAGGATVAVGGLLFALKAVDRAYPKHALDDAVLGKGNGLHGSDIFTDIQDLVFATRLKSNLRQLLGIPDIDLSSPGMPTYLQTYGSQKTKFGENATPTLPSAFPDDGIGRYRLQTNLFGDVPDGMPQLPHASQNENDFLTSLTPQAGASGSEAGKTWLEAFRESTAVAPLDGVLASMEARHAELSAQGAQAGESFMATLGKLGGFVVPGPTVIPSSPRGSGLHDGMPGN